MSDTLPDRLSSDPSSEFHDADLLTRGVGVRFKGEERTNVEEYCISEGWIRVQAGKAKDRRGQPLTIKLKGPAIVTTDLRLNEPRYASLPNIMKAKKKPIEEKAPADYGVNVDARLKILRTEEPAARAPGIKVGSIPELVEKLKNEACVL